MKHYLFTALIALPCLLPFPVQAVEVGLSGLTCAGLVDLVERAPQDQGGAAVLLALGHYLAQAETSQIDLATIPALIENLARHCALPANANQSLDAAFAEAEAALP